MVNQHWNSQLSYIKRPNRRLRLSHNDRFIELTPKTDTYRNSFYCRTIKEWNSLPSNVLDIEKNPLFQKAFRLDQIRVIEVFNQQVTFTTLIVDFLYFFSISNLFIMNLFLNFMINMSCSDGYPLLQVDVDVGSKAMVSLSNTTESCAKYIGPPQGPVNSFRSKSINQLFDYWLPQTLFTLNRSKTSRQVRLLATFRPIHYKPIQIQPLGIRCGYMSGNRSGC